MRDLPLRLLLTMVLALVAGFAADASESLSGSGWSMSIEHPRGSGPHPAVILLPGCSGNTPPAVRAGLRAHSRALVGAGHVVGTLDGLGPRSICTDRGALLRDERRAAVAARVAAAALAKDRRVDARRIGFLGQSFGGSVALRLASAGAPFRAVAAYYPWCAQGYGGEGLSNFRIPVLIMSGDADTWTPVSRCRALTTASGSVRPRIESYAHAVHSFDLTTLPRTLVPGVMGRYPVGGNRSAAAASRSSYLRFFDRHLGR